MKNKRKPVIIVIVVILAIAAVCACLWFFWLKDFISAQTAEAVYVQRVSQIAGSSDGALVCSGIVEPQETYEINKDESKTVKELYVSVGDEVHVGDKLFSYDTDEIQLDLDQAKLDLETLTQEISTLNSQIEELEAEKKNAGQDEQLSYTTRIQSLELQIKQNETDSKKKQNEIDSLASSLQNADVTSNVEGVVKSTNPDGKTNSNTGEADPFISILAMGDFRVKGTVSELNVSSLYVGQTVSVISRLNSDDVWSGTISSIDQEAAGDNSNSYYYYDSGSSEKSSKYNFYISLDSLDGLMLGQHVYIEPGTDNAALSEGLWLPSVYIVRDGDDSYVWAENDNGKLEKRRLTLSDYDEESDMYKISDGLSLSDSIAYPDESLTAGMKTTDDAAAAVTEGDTDDGLIAEGAEE